MLILTFEYFDPIAEWREIVIMLLGKGNERYISFHFRNWEGIQNSIFVVQSIKKISRIS